MGDIPELSMARLVKNCGGQLSGWQQRNRLISDALCTMPHGEPEVTRFTLFPEPTSSDRLREEFRLDTPHAMRH